MRVKLVRDKVPLKDDRETIQAANSPAGRVALLINKMHEEVGEIAMDPWDPEEYADLFEAVSELMRLNGVSMLEVENAVWAKRRAVGGFRQGMVLSRPRA